MATTGALFLCALAGAWPVQGSDPGAVEWVLGAQGASCDAACGSLGQECVPWGAWPTTAAEFASITVAAGVACPQTLESEIEGGDDYNPARTSGSGTNCYWESTNDFDRCAASNLLSERLCPCQLRGRYLSENGTLGPTPLPTPAPTICIDTSGEATCMTGCTCGQWVEQPTLCDYSSYYDDVDFTALDMCCACGGGSTATVPENVTTTTPTTSTTSTTSATSSTSTNTTSTTSATSSTSSTTSATTTTTTTTQTSATAQATTSTATATATEAATSTATSTGNSLDQVAYTPEDVAKAEDTAVLQAIASNQSSITVVVGGLEVTVTKASVSDAVDGFLSLPGVSAATGVDVSLPTSLFAALGVESALVVAAGIPASAVPAGSAGTAVEGAISISLKSDTDGSTLSVAGLADPVLIDLPNISDGLACGYFDEDAMEWTSEGITTVVGAGGTLRCATTHLTIFGAILKGFLTSLECSQASLLSAEAYEELWAGDWSESLGSALLYTGVFLYVAMLLTAHAFDVRDERAGHWGTKEFLIPEFVEDELLDCEPMTPVVSDNNMVPASPPEASPSAEQEQKRSGVSRKLTNGSARAVVVAKGGARKVTKGARKVREGGREASAEGAKESCEGMLQGAIVEIFSAVTNCAGGVTSAVEALVAFAWEFLRGNVTLADVRKMLAARNARHQVCASLLMHSDDLDFLLSPEVERELEVPAPGALDDDGAPLRTLAGTAAEAGDGPAKRRHDLLLGMVTRVRAHMEVALQRRRSSCHTARMAALSFCIHCPVGAVFVPSMVMRRSMRALLLGCELLGAVMIATLFFTTTGGALAKSSPPECSSECEDDNCTWQALGQLIAIGVVSMFLASIPLAIIQLPHQRRFVQVPTEGGQAWKRQLKRWRRRDAFVYVVGALYSLFALNYITLFFANVTAEDQIDLISSSGVSFMQDLVLGPVAWSLVVPGLALCL